MRRMGFQELYALREILYFLHCNSMLLWVEHHILEILHGHVDIHHGALDVLVPGILLRCHDIPGPEIEVGDPTVSAAVGSVEVKHSVLTVGFAIGELETSLLHCSPELISDSV